MSVALAVEVMRCIVSGVVAGVGGVVAGVGVGIIGGVIGVGIIGGVICGFINCVIQCVGGRGAPVIAMSTLGANRASGTPLGARRLPFGPSVASFAVGLQRPAQFRPTFQPVRADHPQAHLIRPCPTLPTPS